MAAMASKASPAGWVVEVASARGPEEGAAPEFRYFNVAIADADKAAAATREKAGVTTTTRIEAVAPCLRPRSPRFTSKAGAVKPA